MFSALKLLSAHPENFTHSLAVLLRYEPNHPDPSLRPSPSRRPSLHFRRTRDSFTPGAHPPGTPNHWAGDILPPTRTIKGQKEAASFSKEWHTLPILPDGPNPIGSIVSTLVLIAVQEDASEKCILTQTLTMKFSQPDLRGRLHELHPSASRSSNGSRSTIHT